MELAPGTLVRDSIRLVRPLGHGSMGSVWVAEHLVLETQVAVKFVHAELVVTDPVAVKRFEREARSAAKIKSPHVVEIFDAGVTPAGVPFLVMELLSGESLGDRLQRGHLPLMEAAEIVGQVARALERAHAAGVIHRDIKPDNIFLCAGDDGRVHAKVLDFGVAANAQWVGSGKLTSNDALVGTPAYMSPEMMRAKPIDAMVDMWALAVVAYQMLTGALPFEAPTMALICVAVCEGSFPAASEIRPGLPPLVDAFFARALNRDPAQRYARPRDLARALLLTAAAESEAGAIDQALDVESGHFSLPPLSGPPAAPESDVRLSWPSGQRAPISLDALDEPSVGAHSRPLGAISQPPPRVTWPIAVVGALVTAALIGVIVAVSFMRDAPTDQQAPAAAPPQPSPEPARRTNDDVVAEVVAQPSAEADVAAVPAPVSDPTSSPSSSPPAQKPPPSEAAIRKQRENALGF